MHKGHNHSSTQNGDSYLNGSNGNPGVTRTTSTFTTASEQPEIIPSPAFDTARPSTTESGWGAYSAPAGDGFNAAPSNEATAVGGFGGTGGDAPNDLGRQLRSNKAIGGVEEFITVSTLR